MIDPYSVKRCERIGDCPKAPAAGPYSQERTVGAGDCPRFFHSFLLTGAGCRRVAGIPAAQEHAGRALPRLSLDEHFFILGGRTGGTFPPAEENIQAYPDSSDDSVDFIDWSPDAVVQEVKRFLNTA
jgi:hypothetical protein